MRIRVIVDDEANAVFAVEEFEHEAGLLLQALADFRVVDSIDLGLLSGARKGDVVNGCGWRQLGSKPGL